MFGLGDKSPLSQEDKIDAIYLMLRRAERSRRFFLALRLAIIGFVAFSLFSFVSDPNAQGIATGAFERYLLPRLTDMAQDMARKMQSDLLEGSTSSGGENMDNVDNPDNTPEGGDSGLPPEIRSLLRRHPDLDREQIEKIIDRLPPGTLESSGTSKEEILASFPE
jgi:hypothetical protein